MKKLSLVLAAALLLGGVSFAQTGTSTTTTKAPEAKSTSAKTSTKKASKKASSAKKADKAASTTAPASK